MSMGTNKLQSNRVREATQIMQAITTLVVISLIYLSSNMLASNATSLQPNTPPTQSYPQVNYWNQDFGYGFSSEKDDKLTNRTASGVDMVAVDNKEGVIFEDAKVRVSYYPTLSMEQIQSRHTDDVSRSYSKLSSGIAVVEGDLDSDSAKTVLATLYSR